MSTRTLAHRILRDLTAADPLSSYDAWKRRRRETEEVITAVYAHAGHTDPDATVLIAQMLDDEGHAAAADLVRELFPPGEDEPPLPLTQARTLASAQTGRLAVVVTLHPRDRSPR